MSRFKVSTKYQRNSGGGGGWRKGKPEKQSEREGESSRDACTLFFAAAF